MGIVGRFGIAYYFLLWSCWPSVIAVAQNNHAFEVATIKLLAHAVNHGNLPIVVADELDFRGGPGTRMPTRINYSGVTLKRLLARAYDVKPEQIVGPKWLDAEQYEVVAKVPPGSDREQLRLMLRTLLLTRFQITLHIEQRAEPVYDLTIAKGGPKLKSPEAETVYDSEEERTAANQRAALSDLGSMLRKARSSVPHRSFHLGHATVGEFAKQLSSQVDYPVNDLTGLEGVYAFTLEWVPDNGAASDQSEPARGPSIATAIQEQLGLRIEFKKESTKVIVVDGADRSPIAN